MIGDLHLHTKLSDGSSSLDDLVFYARRAGLGFISVTDHDTMDGVQRAVILGKRYGLQVVPGAELSCYDGRRDRKAHLLCYLPEKPDRLLGLMKRTLESRTKAGLAMLEKVMRFYPLTQEHVARHSSAGKALYKVHIMQALMDLGYDNQVYGNLYQMLFGKDGSCLVRQEYPDIRDALDAVHEAGGIAVLAHPPVYDSMELLEELCEQGLLDGVESRHPRISEEQYETISEIAQHYGLIQTGGTDFHGFLTGRPLPVASCVVTEHCMEAMYRLKKKMQPG